MSRLAAWWDVAVVASAKAALSVCVLSAGFTALSDDDFSRIVIAEGFAHAPSLDPSGTSWLPLPFWIHGASMMLFGRSLATAHATAVMLGVVSALCIHRAARWVRVTRAGAVLAAVIASSILTAARLGVSAQPEAVTAGFVILGAAATRLDGSRRVAGAVALFAACLCRYEAWAAAAVFALFALYDLLRRSAPSSPDEAPPRPRRAAAMVVALVVATAAPLAWIAHGATFHGDALFFLHRVAAYRKALGATEPAWRSLIAYPAALFRNEPEVTLAGILAFRLAAGRAPQALGRLFRPAMVVGGLFAFLVVGRLFDGAPTHHVERTLLPVWSLLAFLVAEAIVRALSPVGGHPRNASGGRLLPVVLAVALVSGLLRAGRAPETEASRHDECDVGLAARVRVGSHERLLVDTADYGYFAVIAAFGAPERARSADRHDPREPRPVDAFESEEGLRKLLRSGPTEWLVVQARHLPAASPLGTVAASFGDLSLVHLLP